MQIRDREYRDLSDFAYQKKPFKEFTSRFSDGNRHWKIVVNKKFKLHDVDTGFDAVIYESGKDVVVAFRGTQGGDIPGEGLKDLATDIDYIVGGRQVNEVVQNKMGWNITNNGKEIKTQTHVENQFHQSDVLVQQVIKEYPNKKISLTGHSLAGALASYSAVKNNVKAVTFSSPSVVKLLDKKEQEKVKQGKYDKQVVNYVHPKDSIGAGGILAYKNHIGSTYYIGTTYDMENRKLMDAPISRLMESISGDDYYHGSNHYKFDEFGNINNPILTLAATGEVVARSPRYFSPDVGTIKVTPHHLRELAKNLEEAREKLKSISTQSTNDILPIDGLKVNPTLPDEVLQSIHFFNSWGDEDLSELIHYLNEAANSYEKADVLPK
ncbi:lipase family protein [Priestia aryabhattai]